MHAAFLSPEALPDWNEAEALPAGTPPGAASGVAARVGIVVEGGRRVRVDLHAHAEGTCFRDVRCVGGTVFVGYGAGLVVIRPLEGRVETHPLDGYFGHLYTADDLDDASGAFGVLVASASELLSFSSEGVLQWRTGELGIDGVVVEDVQAGIVRGSGEWDPPGGWEAFAVSTARGERAGA